MMRFDTLRVLYDFGQHHVTDYKAVKGGHLLIMGKTPLLKVGAFEGILPISQDRTSGIAANYGFDAWKYVLYDENEADKFEAFWQRQPEVFPKHKALLDRMRDLLQAGDLQVEGKLEDAIKSGWIVLADAKGKPLVDDLSFREWWGQNVGDVLTEVSDEESHCWVTGDLCHPLRVHPKTAGVPNAGKASLMAYQYPEYAFQGQKLGAERGANFPLSAKAGRAIKAALDYALERVNKKLRYALLMPSTTGNEKDANRVLLFIPEGRAESDFIRKYLPLLDRYTTKEDALSLWSALDEEKPSGAQVHLLLLKGSKRRIALLEHEVVTEAHLLKRLLVLRMLSKDSLEGASSKTLVQFVAGNSDEPPLIPYSLQAQMVWSFLLDGPLPMAVRDTIILRNQFTRFHNLWVRQITGEALINVG